MKNYEDFLRGLTRQTVDEALQRTRVRLRREDQRRLPDPGAGPAARRTAASDTGQLIAWGNEIVGNTDPDYAKVPDRPARTATSTSTCRSARPPPSRSSTTAASWRDSARAATAPTWSSILANKLPEDGSPAVRHATSTTTSCCWSSPATRRPGTRSATSMLALIEQRGPAAHAAGGPEPDPRRRRGAAALGLAGLPLPPYGDPRRRAAAASRSRRATRSSCGSPPATATSRCSPTRTRSTSPAPNVDHMTFGKGSPHLCLGNNLARMEIRLMFEELLPRLEVDRARPATYAASAPTSSTASSGSPLPSCPPRTGAAAKGLWRAVARYIVWIRNDLLR